MSEGARQGQRIREARQSKGLTQNRLAELVGVTAQAVSKWETGESAPDIGTIPRLCAALGISRSKLLQADSEDEQLPDPVVQALRQWRADHARHDGHVPVPGEIIWKTSAPVAGGGTP